MPSSWGTSWGDSWGDSWGELTPPPPGSISGSSTLAVTASGGLAGKGFLSGAALVALLAVGSITGGSPPATGLSQADLDAITTAVWAHPQGQAYLAKIDQIEALSIACGNPCCKSAEQPAGGHWKHLLRAIASAETHEVSVRADSRWKLLRPEVVQNYVELAPYVSYRATSRWHFDAAVGWAAPPEVSARWVAAWSLDTPYCGASTGFLRAEAASDGAVLTPECACQAPAVRYAARGYYTFAYPKTVQNPTPEMILELFT